MHRNCPGNSSVTLLSLGKVICVSKKSLENSSKIFVAFYENLSKSFKSDMIETGA